MQFAEICAISVFGSSSPWLSSRTGLFSIFSATQISGRCLERIREHLRPGGALVFDTFDPAFLDEQPEPALDTSFSAGGGLTVDVRYTRHVDADARLLRQQLIFDERDENGRLLRSRKTELLLRCCSRAHTEEMLGDSGFEVAALYGGFRGEPVAEGGVQVWVAVEGK